MPNLSKRCGSIGHLVLGDRDRHAHAARPRDGLHHRHAHLDSRGPREPSGHAWLGGGYHGDDSSGVGAGVFGSRVRLAGPRPHDLASLSTGRVPRGTVTSMA